VAAPGAVDAEQLVSREPSALGGVTAPVEFVERPDQRVDNRQQRPGRGGVPINALGIARKIRQVLATAPDIR
jgi:hypothetical protein